VPEDVALPLARRRRAEATALPAWIKPQLTKLVDQAREGRETAMVRALSPRLFGSRRYRSFESAFLQRRIRNSFEPIFPQAVSETDCRSKG
jgi:hypothetical protein